MRPAGFGVFFSPSSSPLHSEAVVEVIHDAGVSHQDHREYPGAGGSADLPPCHHARGGRGGRESHPRSDGAGGCGAGGSQQPCAGKSRLLI